MRIGVISDIHANSAALRAVLSELDVQKIICLGDLVGYGPRPSESVELVKENADMTVLGNHDAHLAESRASPLLEHIPFYSELMLSNQQKRWLQQLPDQESEGGYLFTHARPGNKFDSNPRPDLEKIASEIPDRFEGLVFGHYHRQIDEKINGKHLVNPGAVGAPRPTKLLTTGKISFKPGYAVIDTDKQQSQLKRTSYIRKTAEELI